MIRNRTGPVMRGPERTQGRRIIGCQRWMAVILPAAIAITAGPALGQARAPQKKGPKREAKAGNTQPSPVKAPSLTPDRARTRQTNRKVTGAPTPNPVGPQPKWVLENTEIELEPVWQGGTVQCIFKIRNEGEADLSIRARGG